MAAVMAQLTTAGMGPVMATGIGARGTPPHASKPPLMAISADMEAVRPTTQPLNVDTTITGMLPSASLASPSISAGIADIESG